MPEFLILFNFLVQELPKHWSVQFHTDKVNHFASQAFYFLLIFGRWNVVSDSMQYFTFNLKTKYLWKVLSWFSIIVHQKDYPDKIWRNPKFHVCPRVLDIYWHPLLEENPKLSGCSQVQEKCPPPQVNQTTCTQLCAKIQLLMGVNLINPWRNHSMLCIS